MKCAKCSQENDVTARFCQYCGAQMASLSEGKRPHEVTIEWLKTVLERIGYSVEETEQGAVLMGKHEDRAHFLIQLRPELGIIVVHSLWGGKKPGWGIKTDMLKAINKANALSILGNCLSHRILTLQSNSRNATSLVSWKHLKRRCMRSLNDLELKNC